MARLYANENFPLPTVEALRELGHDVLTTIDSDNAGQAIPDDAVLVFAHEQKRILLTFNRKHFIRLHNEHPNHSGIIVCTFDTDFNALAQRINNLLAGERFTTGHLYRINRPQQP